MTDILAVFRVEHPDVALTATVDHDPSATLRPVREAGTDPANDRYLFTARSEDFDRLEAGLAADPTVASYERVLRLGGEAVYAISYTDDAILFSTAVGEHNGSILEFANEGTAWRLEAWFPDRAAARALWEFADERGVDVELERVNEYGSLVEGEYGLTESQREALQVALDAGYFDEPRAATLEAVAGALDISEPSASRLLRRGLKRLLRATVGASEE